MELVTPRRLLNFSIERIPVGYTEADPGSVADARDQFLEELKKRLPQVRESLKKAQAKYKRDYDKTVREKNKDLNGGDWVFLDAHDDKRKKLEHKTDGPYEVLETNGWTFLLDIDGVPYRVSSDHVTRAPTPTDRKPRENSYLVRPQAHQPDGPQFVYTKFTDYGWDDDGLLYLRVRWFGYPPEHDTWEPSGNLPVADVYRYCRLNGLLADKEPEEETA